VKASVKVVSGSKARSVVGQLKGRIVTAIHFTTEHGQIFLHKYTKR